MSFAVEEIREIINEVEGFFCQVRKKLSIRGCSHFYHKHCQSQYTIDEYRRYRLSSAKNTTFLRNQYLFDIHNIYIIFRTWCLLGLDVVNQSKPFPNILIGWAKLLCEVNQKKISYFFCSPKSEIQNLKMYRILFWKPETIALHGLRWVFPLNSPVNFT